MRTNHRIVAIIVVFVQSISVSEFAIEISDSHSSIIARRPIRSTRCSLCIAIFLGFLYRNGTSISKTIPPINTTNATHPLKKTDKRLISAQKV